MTANPRPTKQRAVAMDIQPARARRTQPKKPVQAAAKPAAHAVVPQQPAKKAPKKPHWLKKRLHALSQHPLRNHPFIVPVTTFVVLSFLSMFLFVASNGRTLGASDTRLVSLSIDGEERIVPTRANTVKELLERLDISVTDKDIVEPALDAEIIVGEKPKITVHKARLVKLRDGKKEITILSAQPTPHEAAKDAGLTVYPEDRFETITPIVDMENVLREGLVNETIVIERALPIKLNLFGVTYEVRTHAKTVHDLAKEKGFESASVFPSGETQLSKGQSVFITDASKEISVVEEVIENSIETVEDRNLQRGLTEVREPGKLGKRAVIYEIGQDGSRKPLQEVVIEQPVNKIVVKGTKILNLNVSQQKQEIMAAAGISPEDFAYADYIISKESSWNLAARNSGGCLGLGQACPGSKLTNACPNYDTDAVCQMRFFSGYANTCVSYRPYCGWEGAYNFWVVNHWW